MPLNRVLRAVVQSCNMSSHVAVIPDPSLPSRGGGTDKKRPRYLRHPPSSPRRLLGSDRESERGGGGRPSRLRRVEPQKRGAPRRFPPAGAAAHALFPTSVGARQRERETATVGIVVWVYLTAERYEERLTNSTGGVDDLDVEGTVPCRWRLGLRNGWPGAIGDEGRRTVRLDYRRRSPAVVAAEGGVALLAPSPGGRRG